ncbi:MAG: glycosyltransferase [Candidatus Aphodosoma sp.]
MPKISIIVPVYKVEKYLRRCVDSILAQTFTDWECILVDDGSPDESGAICDEYAQKDARIQVIHKENGGVSSARNVALDRMTGKWLIFVDSDDCLYPNALQKWFEVAEQNNLDLIQCHFNREYKEGQVENDETEVLSAVKYADSERYLTCVWGTLFKVSIVKEKALRFDEKVSLGEDQIYLLNYMQYCKRIQLIGDVLYFYRNNEQSAVNNPKPEYEMASVRAFKELKRNNPIASKRCDAMLLSWFVFLILSSKTPASVIKDLYKDVNLAYLSLRAKAIDKMAYYLMKVNIPFTVHILRTIYSIKKHILIHKINR